MKYTKNTKIVTTTITYNGTSFYSINFKGNSIEDIIESINNMYCFDNVLDFNLLHLYTIDDCNSRFLLIVTLTPKEKE